MLVRHRFDRKGNVVRDTRRTTPIFGTDDYRRGDAIFLPRSSSPARLAFRSRSNARRLAA